MSWLDRALGPDRMPWPLKRFPRGCGAAMVLAGVWLASELGRVSEQGGVYLTALPIMTTAALGLGAWFAVLGRPADAQGHAPHWWNVGYAATLVVAFFVAIIVKAALL